MQEELDKERKRFSLAIEGSKDGLWDWNLVDDSAYISSQYEIMLGYEPGELPRTKEAWVNQLHPRDKEIAFKRIKQYFQKKVLEFMRTALEYEQKVVSIFGY